MHDAPSKIEQRTVLATCKRLHSLLLQRALDAALLSSDPNSQIDPADDKARMQQGLAFPADASALPATHNARSEIDAQAFLPAMWTQFEQPKH